MRSPVRGWMYGANLISVNQFTVSDVDDDNATKLIWYLSTKASDRKACASSAPGWLPDIKFAAGEDNINVAKASGSSAYPATAQRIINCANSASSSMPVQYADDVERDRVEKIEAAAEGVETGRLDKDCSKTGCPGADIVGQTGRVYHASYGRTQFIGATFLEVVNSLPAPDKLAMGLDTDMQRRLNQALRRAEKVSGSPKTIGMFNWVRQVASCANAPAYWDGVGQPGGMSTVDQTVFVQQTQLDRQAFIDMACFVPEAPARPTNEGRQAFATESILTDSVLGGWMMGIFKNTEG
jgi:hypothetical protein